MVSSQAPSIARVAHTYRCSNSAGPTCGMRFGFTGTAVRRTRPDVDTLRSSSLINTNADSVELPDPSQFQRVRFSFKHKKIMGWAATPETFREVIPDVMAVSARVDEWLSGCPEVRDLLSSGQKKTSAYACKIGLVGDLSAEPTSTCDMQELDVLMEELEQQLLRYYALLLQSRNHTQVL